MSRASAYQGGMHTPVMRCTSPSDLLAIPAVLLGFHPEESLVVMGMSGKKVAFSARLDVDWHVHAFDQVRQQVLEAAERAGAESFFLLGYTTDPDLAFLSISEAITAIGEHLVAEALVTDGIAYWSMQDNSPPQRFSFDSSSVAAQAVFEGRVIAPSRADVVASVEAWDPPAPEVVDAERLRLDTCAEDESRATLPELLVPPSPLTEGQALTLALLLGDEWVASDLLGLMTSQLAEDVWPQLALARRVAPADCLVNVLGLLGFATWLKGGGAALTSCVEQLMALDAEHPHGPDAGLVPPARDPAELAGRATSSVRCMRFVVCGEALVDLMPEEAISSSESRWIARSGGGPLNTSVALAKLGCDSHFLGRVSSACRQTACAGAWPPRRSRPISPSTPTIRTSVAVASLDEEARPATPSTSTARATSTGGPRSSRSWSRMTGFTLAQSARSSVPGPATSSASCATPRPPSASTSTFGRAACPIAARTSAWSRTS